MALGNMQLHNIDVRSLWYGGGRWGKRDATLYYLLSRIEASKIQPATCFYDRGPMEQGYIPSFMRVDAAFLLK